MYFPRAEMSDCMFDPYVSGHSLVASTHQSAPAKDVYQGRATRGEAPIVNRSRPREGGSTRRVQDPLDCTGAVHENPALPCPSIRDSEHTILHPFSEKTILLKEEISRC